MLKGMGAVFVFSGCAGLGILYRQQYRDRIRTLRILENILELLASQVRYGRATLPECCRLAAGQMKAPFDEAFRDVAERMEENGGSSFAEVFRERLGGTLKGLPLSGEDRELFLQFVSDTGYQDGQMQLRAMEQSRELLAETERRLEKECADRSRMAVGFGIMGGLFIILILW